ncbi:MAG: HDOD domain-containing protein [Phycisphaerae bacterium]|nr:HDOD domain-containing protein [Phycisphaerae bacterium]
MGDIPTAATKTPKQRLQGFVEQLSEVSTLPSVLAKIMTVIDDPGTGSADLKAVVECDPALTSRVLKLVNSAYFGLRNSTSNLQNAISLLGFNAVRNLAVTASVSNVFKDEFENEYYSRKGLWEHMVSVALCARMMVRRSRLAQFEDAYLGGLLHDIGTVMFDQHAHGEFCNALRMLQLERDLRACEHAVFGFDHTQLGAVMAGVWKFPDLIIQCIRWHHQSHRATGQSRHIRQIAAAVELSDFLCTQKGAGAVRTKVKPHLSPYVLSDLKIDRSDLRVLWAEMDKELAAARDWFKL